MSRDPTRAALALLCVVVVLFGGSLFPTAGFGSYPAGIGGGNGAPDSPAGPPDAGVEDGPASTVVGPTETARTTTDDGRTETETPTETETETETPATGGSDGDGSSSGLLAGLLGLLGGGSVAVVLFAFAPGIDERTTVAGLPVGRFQTNLRSFFAAVPRRTTSFVVGLSASVPGVLDRVRGVTAGAAATFAVVAAGALRGGGRSLLALGRGLGTAATSLPRAFAGVAALFGGLRRAAPRRLSRRRTRGTATAGDDSATPAAAAEADESDPTPRSVEEAWAAMAERVPVGNRTTATPGEYARAAVDAGFPETAVRRLTRAFERVRYGGASDREELPAVRDALARIRSFLDGGEES